MMDSKFKVKNDLKTAPPIFGALELRALWRSKRLKLKRKQRNWITPTI